MLSQSYAPTHSSKKWLAIDNRLYCEGSCAETSYPHEKTDAFNGDQWSLANDSPLSQGGDPVLLEHAGRRKQGFEIRPDFDTHVHADISCSEVEGSEAPDTEALCSTDKNQARTLSPLNCSRDSRSQQPECRKLSLSQEIDRHHSERENAGSTNTERPKSQRSASRGSHVNDPQDDSEHSMGPERLDCLSPAPSIKSSRLASETMQESRQSQSRSTSWLSKLAGFNIF